MTPVHPIDSLEALLTQGRALTYEMERHPDRAWVSIHFLEYDAGSPLGVASVVHGYGETLEEAVQEAVRKLPVVKA